MSYLQTTHYKLQTPARVRAGQVALSTIFLIGGIIVLYGTTLALVAISFLDSAFGFQAANRALGLAYGGIYDAEIQLLRNKDFSDSGYCVPAALTPCPSGFALVAITQSAPAAGQVTVTSEATEKRRHRKVEAVFEIATSTGAVTLLRANQVSL